MNTTMTEKEREERSHRPISPSGLKRIIACPGSFALSQTVVTPYTTSKAAIDGNTTGTLLEHVLNKIFDERFQYKIRVGSDYELLTKASCETLHIEDEDGKRCARIVEIVHYLNRWREEVIEVYPGAEFFHFSQEQFVECWGLEGGEGVGGSADILMAWRIGQDVSFAVMDLKDGGVPVYALYDTDEGSKLNPQLVAYAAGYVRYLVEKKLALPSSFSYVHLHILQPKTDNWDSAILRWNQDSIIRGSLLSSVKEIKERTELAWSLKGQEDVTGHLKVNDECRYCKAKLICPKVYQEVSPTMAPVIVETQAPSVPMMVQEMSIEAKVKLIKNRKLIEEVIKEVRKEFVATLLAGGKIEGVKLINAKPDQLVWSKDVSEEERRKILREIGVNPVKEQDRSCADVKKEIGEATVKQLGITETKSFGLTVVSENERGKQIVITGENEQLFLANDDEDENE